jgi:hypothetical protein
MAAKRKMARKPLSHAAKVKNLKRLMPKRPRVLVLLKRQSGKQSAYGRKVDRKRPGSLPPGKRVSRNGKVYWETRQNRSDIGKLL